MEGRGNLKCETLKEICLKRVLDEDDDLFCNYLDSHKDRLMRYLEKRPKVVEKILYKHEPDARAFQSGETCVVTELLAVLNRKICQFYRDVLLKADEQTNRYRFYKSDQTFFISTGRNDSSTTVAFVVSGLQNSLFIDRCQQGGVPCGIRIDFPQANVSEYANVSYIYEICGPNAIWNAAEKMMDFIREQTTK